MEILLNLPNFILNLFTFTTVLIILSGVFLGILLGALPGFGSAQSLAILFPLTFVMSTSDSLIFLLAVYSAAEYGGSIPAILIKTLEHLQYNIYTEGYTRHKKVSLKGLYKFR